MLIIWKLFSAFQTSIAFGLTWALPVGTFIVMFTLYVYLLEFSIFAH